MQSLNTGQKVSGSGELLCEHKGTETPQFAYGLCKDCYKYVNSQPPIDCFGILLLSLF